MIIKKLYFEKNWLILGSIVIFLAVGATVLSFTSQNLSQQKPATTAKPNPNKTPPNLSVTALPTIPIYTLDSIFRYSDPAQESAIDNEFYTLIATGDIIPARSVNAKMTQLNNFNYSFEKTAEFLKNSDITFINLESPLVAGYQVTQEGMSFCGDERSVEGLVYAGVDVANLANNHAGNRGIGGIESTASLLKQDNIAITGNGEAAIVNIRDKKFGFLGYNDIGAQEAGIAWADNERIKNDIAELKKRVDFVIATFHWGTEYTLVPTTRQIELAHLAIDSGADLIIGNHPHWVQGVEQYKGKFITYAHGNFVFDQMWSQETREGVVGKYVFDKNGLVDVKFYPVIIENYAQPRFATQNEALKILGRMEDSTLKLQSSINSQ